MKSLKNIEMNVVFGGACSGVASEMCVSSSAKTSASTGTCTGDYGKGNVGGVAYYFYCYVTSIKDIDTMAADTTFCDSADNHEYQTTAASGRGVAGATGSYKNC